MMKTSHVRLSLAAGSGIMAVGAQALGVTWVADILMVPAMMGGAAEWNDIDQKGSSVYRALPVAGWGIHWIVVWLHRFVYFCTYRRGKDDPLVDVVRRSRYRGKGRKRRRNYLCYIIPYKVEWDSAHRGLTHGITFCVVVGVLVGWCCFTGPLWVAPLLIVCTVILAGDLVFAGPLLLLYTLLGLSRYGSYGILEHLSVMGPLWGFAVGMGMIMHVVGDQCTKYGNPLLAPFSWYYFRLPYNWAMTTGKTFENNYLKYILIGANIFTGYLLLMSLT